MLIYFSVSIKIWKELLIFNHILIAKYLRVNRILYKKMKQNSTTYLKEFMEKFASNTGLYPEIPHPKRYLWTDAFAVCNYLELFERTNDESYIDLTLKLIYQVHHVLGKNRTDNPNLGWISGLEDEYGEKHPTIGGLRIGKEMKERLPTEPFNDPLELG